MTIFEQESYVLDMDSLPIDNTDPNFQGRIRPILSSITQQLETLDNSLTTIQNKIPGIRDGQITADDHPQYKFINDYLLNFSNEIVEFEQINPPLIEEDLESMYQYVEKFNQVITMINTRKDDTIQQIISEFERINRGESSSPAPADYSNLFTFENEMTLDDFLKNFDDGIANFNEKVSEYNDNKKEFNTLYEKVDENIHKRQAEETIGRGNVLISEKIEYYESWIKLMYYLHRILLVILCIIIIISLVYKLL